MIGVHIVKPVDARLVGVFADRAERAVRHARTCRPLGLLLVSGDLGSTVSLLAPGDPPKPERLTGALRPESLRDRRSSLFGSLIPGVLVDGCSERRRGMTEHLRHDDRVDLLLPYLSSPFRLRSSASARRMA
jgi:hypothetical protein